MSIDVFRFGPFVLDEAKRELRKNDNERVAVPGTVLRALCYLARHRHRAVGRQELAHAIFRRTNVSDAQVAQIVLQARRAIDDDGNGQEVIRTIARFGYRWVAGTVVESSAADAPAALQTRSSEAARNPQPANVGALGTAVVAAVAVVLVAWKAWVHAPAAPPPQVVNHAPMVLPANIDGPTDAVWARLGLMDLVANRLHHGGVDVLPGDATLALLGQNADSKRLLGLAPGGMLIQPQIARRGLKWNVALLAAEPDGAQRRSEAEDAELLIAARLASDRLLSALGYAPRTGAENSLDLEERLQRAQAALLANEMETARTILQSAPDEQRADPEVLLRLAQIDFRSGRLDAAERALDALVTSKRAQWDAAVRSRSLRWRAAVRHQLGRPNDAERDLDQAIESLGKGDEHRRGEELMSRAAIRTTLGRYDEALDDFDNARTALLRYGDPLAVARLDANVGRLEYQRGRTALAVDYLAKASQQFTALGAMGDLLQALSLRSTANRELLRFDAAWNDSETAWSLRSHAADPALRLTIALNRADVLMDLGRFAEARAMLGDPYSAAAGGPNEERRRAYTFIELAWRTGRIEQAVQLADALLAQWPADQWSVRRDWTILRRQQAALLAGMAPLETGLPGNDKSGIAPPLSAAILKRWQGDVAEADALYRSAMAVAEGDGVPADIAEVVQSYAPWLMERGRLAEAATLVGRVSPWSDRDFTCAALELQLARALHRDDWVDAAAEKVLRLAGERSLPPAGSFVSSVPLMSSR